MCGIYALASPAQKTNRLNNKGQSKEDRDGRGERKSWRKSRPMEEEKQKKGGKKRREGEKESERAALCLSSPFE